MYIFISTAYILILIEINLKAKTYGFVIKLNIILHILINCCYVKIIIGVL